MFLRFTLERSNPNTGARDGIFETAYELRDSGGLPNYEEQELADLLRWFEERLPEPDRFNRTKSKGYYRRATKGICWLRPEAVELISKMRSLSAILEENGHHVSMIKTENPGYIVYEDDHQVVAEPFPKTRSL